jgi:hypothetical protein
MNRFLISKESKWKATFDMAMLFLSCYNTFVSAYYAAFGTPKDTWKIIFDYTVEFYFFLDLIF